MNSTYLIENTFNPAQFAATVAVGTAGTVAAKSDNTWVIVLIVFLIVAIAFAAWEYSERPKSFDSQGEEAY